MHQKDLHPALLVRPVHQHLPVEPPSPQQRRIEDFRTVGGGEQYHAAGRIEAVELAEKLVEGLFLLVVAAAARQEAAAGAAKRVEFVDEDDGGRALAGLLEQVADPGGADADEHFDKLGSRDREERHAGLTGNGAGEQGLAGAGRADEQDALGHAGAQPAVRGGVLEEIDDLPQFVLGFIDTGDVGESDLGIGFQIDLRLALADRHQAADAALAGHRADHEHPQQQKTQRRDDPAQHGHQHTWGRFAGERHLGGGQLVREVGRHAKGGELLRLIRFGILEGAGDAGLPNHQVGQFILIESLLELAVGDDLGLRCLQQEVLDQRDRQNGDDDVPEGNVVLALDLHRVLPISAGCGFALPALQGGHRAFYHFRVGTVAGQPRQQARPVLFRLDRTVIAGGDDAEVP